MTETISTKGMLINERSTRAEGSLILQRVLGFVIALFGLLFLFAFVLSLSDAMRKYEAIKLVYSLAAGAAAYLFLALARSLVSGEGVPIWFARLIVIGTVSLLTFAAVDIWLAPESWSYVPMFVIPLIYFPQVAVLLWTGKYKGDVGPQGA